MPTAAGNRNKPHNGVLLLLNFPFKKQCSGPQQRNSNSHTCRMSFVMNGCLESFRRRLSASYKSSQWSFVYKNLETVSSTGTSYHRIHCQIALLSQWYACRITICMYSSICDCFKGCSAFLMARAHSHNTKREGEKRPLRKYKASARGRTSPSSMNALTADESAR